MAKIIWKANQVISIETKRKDENRETNVYVLAQMINKVQLLIFDLFNTDNDWSDIDIEKAPILFCTSVTRQFITNSNIFKQNIKGLINYEAPKRKIDSLGMGSRYVTVWGGTPDEKKILILGQGGGRLIEKDISLGIGIEKVIIPSVAKTDLETINKYELTNVRIYAEFNERLYLCYKMKKNVDPLKDLIFDLPIPLEYKEYMDIISS
jgi:hypothetical protein